MVILLLSLFNFFSIKNLIERTKIHQMICLLESHGEKAKILAPDRQLRKIPVVYSANLVKKIESRFNFCSLLGIITSGQENIISERAEKQSDDLGKIISTLIVRYLYGYACSFIGNESDGDNRDY